MPAEHLNNPDDLPVVTPEDVQSFYADYLQANARPDYEAMHLVLTDPAKSDEEKLGYVTWKLVDTSHAPSEQEYADNYRYRRGAVAAAAVVGFAASKTLLSVVRRFFR